MGQGSIRRNRCLECHGTEGVVVVEILCAGGKVLIEKKVQEGHGKEESKRNKLGARRKENKGGE